MRSPTGNFRRALLAGAVAVYVAIPSGANAAGLAIPDVPLFLTTGAEPNIMVMIDSSGSMLNIVPDVPYVATTTYACSSSSSTVLSNAEQIDIRITAPGGLPYFRYDDNTNYDWGTGNGTGLTGRNKRCFNPTLVYVARLNGNNFVDDGNNDYRTAVDYLPAQYTGNYLNWYFGTNTSNVYGTQSTSFGTNAAVKLGTKWRLAIAQTAAKGLVDSMSGDMRVGLSKYNGGDGGQLAEGVSILDAAKKTTVKTKIDGIAAGGNTPLAETLSDIGYYFSRGATNLTLHPSAASPTTSARATVFSNGYTRSTTWDNGSNPIQYSCQRSFAVLLTDGRPQGDQNINALLTDYDGDCSGTNASQCSGGYDRKTNQEYESEGSDYLDDVAMALYEMDLRPDLVSDVGIKNNVTTHMISFADYQALNDPLMPRAARQGGGRFFTAGNEAELITAFNAALDSIVAQNSSAASASVNSGSISDTTRIYQAKFDSGDWSGQLLSYDINDNGTVGALQWDAGKLLPVPASRKIITVSAAGAGVPFKLASLDATRLVQLDPAYTASNTTLASTRVDYLRGDATNEGTTTGKFRPRPATKLGDIINSSPVFVGDPQASYPDSLQSEPYSTFRRDYSDTDGEGSDTGRTPVIYAGANDGMLHAFNANSGSELFAFIPGSVFGNLRLLSDQPYAHKFFVDAPPNAGDAFVGGHWRTVLVGGLNLGGQSVYALNVTNPSNFSEDNASTMFMWEFTDRDGASTGITGDPDLGYSYSQPAIVRLRTGDWVAIFGNGYNSTTADGSASATGNAVLFIVDIATGKLIKKLDTGVGAAQDPKAQSRANGLSTPAAVDINGDSIVDYVFAGDLFGNMWKFDLRGTNASNWKIAFGTTASPQPLFTAVDPGNSTRRQPITSRPEIIRGPRGVGMMVLFGTGKYLESSDTTVNVATPELQTYYGLFDRNTGNSSDAIDPSTDHLVEQTILSEAAWPGSNNTVKVRVTSNTPLGATDHGWYLTLRSPSGYQGERVVSNTTVRAGRVVFTTLIPDSTPCGHGGTSWLMELDALSGARLTTSPFDLNRDGRFDGSDSSTDNNGAAAPASGVQQVDGGITPTPGILLSEDGTKEYKYSPGSNGGISVVVEDPGKGASGRQSWRQIR